MIIALSDVKYLPNESWPTRWWFNDRDTKKLYSFVFGVYLCKISLRISEKIMMQSLETPAIN